MDLEKLLEQVYPKIKSLLIKKYGEHIGTSLYESVVIVPFEDQWLVNEVKDLFPTDQQENLPRLKPTFYVRLNLRILGIILIHSEMYWRELLREDGSHKHIWLEACMNYSIHQRGGQFLGIDNNENSAEIIAKWVVSLV